MNELTRSVANLDARKRELLALLARKEGIDPLRLPIPSLPRDRESYPLSFEQERLWVIDQIEPGNAAYNLPATLLLLGPLRLDVLERSFGEVVRRHQILRTTFTLAPDGTPAQAVGPPAPVVIPLVDLQALPAAALPAEMERLMESDGNRPFDLGRGPLLRIGLLRLARGTSGHPGDERHALLLNLHHIVSDGWSNSILVRELGELYTAFLAGRPSPLPELPLQYVDFAHWQRNTLRGEVLEAAVEYWRRRLTGAPVLELPTDRLRPAMPGSEGGIQAIYLPDGLAEGLRSLARAEGATFFMAVLATLQAQLCRYAGQDDVSVGTPIANRHRREVEELIGFFVNTLVIRTDLAGDPSFQGLLERVRKGMVEAFEHQHLPFSQVVEAVHPERSLAHTPLFQVLCSVGSAIASGLESRDELPEDAPPAGSAGLEFLPIGARRDAAMFDLSFSLLETRGGYNATLEYRTDLFDGPTARRMLEHFATLAAGAVADPGRRLSELPLLTGPEWAQLLAEWNDTATGLQLDLCLHELVGEQVRRTPHAPALRSGGETLSYADLWERSGLLARHLRAAGVGPEARVGVCLPRSPDLVAALLAVLRAGGAYVPLDPGYPGERLRFLLEDSGAAVIVTQEELIDRLPSLCVGAGLAPARVGTSPTPTSDGWVLLILDPRSSAPTLPGPANLAYLIYTSGSTGRPKGVGIEHRSAVALIRWATSTFPTEDLAAVLASTSINFDLSIFEIFAPLSLGGTVVLVDDALGLDGLGPEAGVTLVNTVPSAMAELVRLGAVPPTVRSICLAGEALPRRLFEEIRAAHPSVRVWNLYGPSEDTTYSTLALVEEEGGAPPIGRPVAGTRAHVLDPAFGLLPIGVPGELCLAGDGLARGYLGRPEQTAERFLPDPFGEAGSRLYRTGDLARHRADGRLDFLGRLDRQVKVRGFRVELGEIEAVLGGHPEVREAAVAVREGSLIAFVAGPPSDLRGWLSERLPEPFIPTAWRFLEAMPLTPNGKVDRKALARLAEDEVSSPEAAFAEPRNAGEELLAGIWASVLRLGDRRIGIHESFFELGGHSLTATQVVSRIRETFRAELPVRALFEAPTLAELARRVEAASGHAAALPALERVWSAEPRYPLSFSQERLWLLDQIEPGNTAYNLPLALRLAGPLRVEILARALTEVARRHATLRTTFALAGDHPVQVVHPPAAVPLPRIDLEALPEAARESEAVRIAADEAASPFDLERGPVLRARLLVLAQEDHALLLTVHHIASDAWSTGILMDETVALCAAFSQGLPSPLPELPLQYADFAVWQRQAFRGEVLESALEVWRHRLAGVPVLELPTDRPRPEIQGERGAAERAGFPAALQAGLQSLVRREGATLFMGLAAAFAALLSRHGGGADFAIGSPVAGRDRTALEGLIGFFVNTLVLRADLGGDPSFRELLRRMRAVALEAYAHQEVPFEKLVEELNPERSLAHTPLFQVMLALQNAPGGGLEVPGLRFDSLPLGTVSTKFDLTLTVLETGDGLAAILEYRTDLFEAGTARGLLERLGTLLAGAVSAPGARLSDLPLLAEGEQIQALAAEPPLDRGPRPARTVRIEPETGPVDPRNSVEALVAGIWAELLHRQPIGIHDNFFDLGGHSLLATQVVSRLRNACRIDLPVRAVFEAPTVAQLARRITEEGTGADAGPALQGTGTRRADPDRLPLSFAQERLWVLEQIERGNVAYNLPSALRLSGPLRPEVLAAAFSEVVRRHEALRTTFRAHSGEPVQVVHPPVAAALPITDLSALPATALEAEARRLADEEVAFPFDLFLGPLLRVRLLRLAPREHALLLTMHHIVSDGWSIGVLIREVVDLYGSFLEGRPSPLPELPLQYADYALWQREALRGPALDAALEYWRRQLAGAPVLDLPADRPRPAVQGSAGAVEAFAVSTGTTEALQTLARREGATLFMALLAAFQALLSRYADQTDLAVGTPVAGRDRTELEGLIGFFVNTLVLRVDLSGDPPFSEALGRVRAVALEAFAHQSLPFERLVEELNPERSLARTPLFQVLFALQNTPGASLEVPGLAVSPFAAASRTSKFDLSLSLAEAGGGIGLSGGAEYRTELFDAPTVRRLLDHFALLIAGAAADPDRPLSELPLLPESERAQVLVEWNATASHYPRHETVHGLFAARAAAAPEALAIEAADGRWTYGDLDRAAGRLAGRLAALGVGLEDRVAVALPRSAELIVALLAALKAGASYVPLDPDHPAERRAFMLEDSGARILMTRSDLGELGSVPAGWAGEVIAVDEEDPREPAAVSAMADADNLAYVMYTSGSTGRPKGIAIPHRGIVRLLVNTDFIALQPDDRVAQVSNTSFDAATFEIWGALLAGACLVVLPREAILSPVDLAAELRRSAISTLHLTSALFHQFAREASGAGGELRHLLFGGESADPHWARQMLASRPPQRLVHLYGPTESTSFASWNRIERVEPEAANLRIGRPLANTRLDVLDRHLRPVPIGVPGQLHVGGGGLARSYLGQPDLTAERFLPDPFAGIGARRAGERLYATGDLARYRPNGEIEFLGRIDHQVKIRGFRIEPGEIETVLAGHPDVAEAAVLALDDPTGKRLAAVVVPAAGRETGALRAWLAECLPDYMVPSSFLFVDALPLTPNGKVDRQALARRALEEARPDRTAAFTAPHTPAEEVLAGIWEGLLGLEDGPPVGVHDDFFELGGYSLLATQVTSRVREVFGVSLAVRSVFENPTVAALAGHIDASLRETDALPLPPLEAGPPEPEPTRLSFAQERLWLIDRMEPESAAYNIPTALRLRGRLLPQALAAAFAEVVRRHASLRTVFARSPGEGGKPVQIVRSETPDLPCVDLAGLPVEVRELEAARLAREEAARPFDLARGPVLRVRRIALAEDDCVLLLTVHHIVSDGWSMGILVGEVTALYAAFAEGRPSPLPELPFQYVDYARWQRRNLQGETLERQIAYWRRQLAGLPVLELPADRPRRAPQGEAGENVSLALGNRAAAAARAAARQQGATLFMVLMAAFQTLLGRLTGQPDFGVGTPVAGRDRTELEPLVGFFVNTLVLRADLSGAPAFGEVVVRVRQATLEALAHQEVPFEKIVEELNPERSLSHTPLFQVVLALQNAPPGKAAAVSDLAFEPLAASSETAKYDLTLSAVEAGHGLSIAAEYRTELLDRATVRRLLGHLEALLGGIGSERRLEDLPLLSEPERSQLLLEWSTGLEPSARDLCLHELFEEKAREVPDAPAVRCGGVELSYAELNRRADRLARRLIAGGTGPEARVGVFLERSIERVVAMLAVLKAGGVYVPFDPAFPTERLELLAEDSGIGLLIVQGPGAPDLGVPVLEIGRGEEEDPSPSLPSFAGEGAPGPDNLAYILYTSGSTGRPKGVQVPHCGVASSIREGVRLFGLQPGDRFLHVASPAFDISVFEIFIAFASGACLAIAGREILPSGAELAAELRRERIHAAILSPSVVATLPAGSEAALPDLRMLLAAAEPCPAELVRRWAPGRRFLNLYGPTEASIYATWWEQSTGPVEETPPPIGRPIPGARLLVLDAGGQPAPAGVPGELCLGGIGLARGYLNRADRTAESFVPDPFSEIPGERLYRSGDLCRWRPDGHLEILRRIDRQVKLRGFRIEPGEIEAAVLSHPAVRQAAVEVRSGRLIAWAAAAPDLSEADLRAHLRGRLPEFMIPAALVLLGDLPRTASGKLDRSALPEPGGARPGLAVAYAAPRAGTESTVAAIWRDVLTLPGVDSVGREDNFFDLGGHSLLLVEVQARLRERLDREVSMLDLFRHPNIAALAGFLSEPAPSPALAPMRNASPPRESRDVAVIGLAGRFPGANDLEAFWRNLRDGVDSVRHYSPEELAAAGVPPEWIAHPGFVPAGAQLDGAERFDAPFFDISPREAQLLDPQHRLFLECAAEALERAGYGAGSPGIAGSRVGVIAGGALSTYGLQNLVSNPGALGAASGMEVVLGNDKDFLATRAAYKLNLQGPALSVQTACSTSLVAVHLAVKALLDGECEIALAGGVTVQFPRRPGYFYQEGGTDSPDGRTRAFDARGKGTLSGEGVGVVVLKPLAAALADGDPIHAVIRGSGINNDGSAKAGFTAPSEMGEAGAISAAHALAGVAPETIGYVEAHGTATPLGDPIEVAALTRAFRSATDGRGFCALGSVKTNIGHAGSAAGVAGLLKAVLALEHREIPPSLHFETPNPAIDFAGSPFYVNAALAPWPAGGGHPRRAGVSSFGMGGTNAHVVLEEAPVREPSGPSRAWQLVSVSARTAAALDAATDRLAEHLLGEAGEPLADAAFTLHVGRKGWEHRRAVVCRDRRDAAEALASRDPRRILESRLPRGGATARPVAFVLSGLGEQYPGMAAGLYRSEPAFREAFDRCAELFAPLLGEDLRELLFPESGGEEDGGTDLRRLLGRAPGAPEDSDLGPLDRTVVLQPALFAVEHSLARLWMEWGIVPQALIGYSLGEYVAACLAGVLSLEDAVRLVAERARLIDALPDGAMLAVPMPEAEILPLLDLFDGDLSLAAVNGPALCVVAGPAAPIAELEELLTAEGCAARRLRTTHAFHSREMGPVAAPLAALVAGLALEPPRIPFLSNVTGTWITAEQATDPQYWAKHLRQPVRFADGLAELWREPGRVLLEIGPGGSLSALALQQAGEAADPVAVATLRAAFERRPDTAFLLATLGKLWLAGVAIDWVAFYARERRQRIELPSYPFERQVYRIEPSPAGVVDEAASGRSARRPPAERRGRGDIGTPRDRRRRTPLSAGDVRARLRLDGSGSRRSARPAGSAPFLPISQEAALDDMAEREAARPAAGPFALHGRPDLRNPYVAPESETERAVAAMWQALLGVEPVGLHDSFFDLGGDSLLATQVMSRVRASYGIELPLRALFEAPTPAGLSEWIERGRQPEGPAIPPLEPLPPEERSAEMPLSFAQQRLWFLDRLAPDTPLYNISAVLPLPFTVAVPILAASFAEIARRHETLRTTFAERDGEPVQVLQAPGPVELPVADLSGLPEGRRPAEAGRLASREARRPFDLAIGPLLRVTLLRLAPDDHLLLGTLHHTIGDGWSMAVFTRETAALYGAFSRGLPSPLPELPLQYSDFAVWQSRWLQGAVLDAEIGWWRGRLEGAPAVLELPIDRPRPAVRTYRGESLPAVLPAALAEGVAGLGRREGSTVFMVLLAALQALLGRISGRDDVSVGTPIAGRNRVETEGLIGFFVNTLVMRADLSGDLSFSGHLARVRASALEAQAHQDLPFEKLVEALAPERSLSHSPLFQVLFTLQNAAQGGAAPAAEAPGAGGALPQASGVDTGTSKFDLTLGLAETAAGIAGSLIYSADLFDRTTAERLLGQLRILLAAAVEDPSRRLSELPLLDEAARQQLLVEWNDTTFDSAEEGFCLHQLFEMQASLQPEEPAVVCGWDRLTYGELDRRAGRLAGRLLQRGAGPETRVALCLPRSIEMVIGVLGILKAGAAYVPLDPSHPQERLALVLEELRPESGPPFVVTLERLAGRFPEGTARVLKLGSLEELEGEPPAEGAVPVEPGNAAYVLYTSGSTGRPKGVVVEHRQIVSYLAGLDARLGVKGAFAMLQPLTVDSCKTALYPPLLSGGILHVVPEDRALDPQALAESFRRDRIDGLKIAPSHLAALQAGVGPAEVLPRETLIFGGEASRLDWALELERTGACRVFNHYGPTEATVGMLTCRIEPGLATGPSLTTPVGRPLPNTRALLLDRHLQPVAQGIAGELLIGGACLARGYLNRPDLTAEKFVPDPFAGSRGGRLYRTGDLMRHLADGKLEFLGRIDQQVKVRGFRIELGEIEAMLARHSGVREALVALREDAVGGPHLVAYLVPSEREAPAPGDLQAFLRERLPEYMVPTAFVILDSLPRTSHGKVDRKALPPASLAESAAGDGYAAPRTPVEKTMAEVWADVLGVERVGLRDDFFALGGHSLLAVRLMARIRARFGRDLPISVLFQRPTVERLAAALEDRSVSTARSALVGIQTEGRKLPFFCAHPIGGSVFCYSELARSLGTDRPFYGLQAPPPEDLRSMGSLKEMAAVYIEAIRALQEQGPYLIGGWSMGGLLALEMAQQLREAGQRIGLLALIDPSLPRRTVDPGQTEASLALGFARDLAGLYGVRLPTEESELTGLPARDGLRRLFERWKTTRLLPADLGFEDLWERFEVYRLNLAAMFGYTPRPYGGPIALFAAERPGGKGLDLPAAWRPFAESALEVHRIPGDHYTLLRDPCVKALAHSLRGRLNRAELSSPPGSEA